jgi:hypothetical protein
LADCFFEGPKIGDWLIAQVDCETQVASCLRRVALRLVESRPVLAAFPEVCSEVPEVKVTDRRACLLRERIAEAETKVGNGQPKWATNPELNTVIASCSRGEQREEPD